MKRHRNSCSYMQSQAMHIENKNSMFNNFIFKIIAYHHNILISWCDLNEDKDTCLIL